MISGARSSIGSFRVSVLAGTLGCYRLLDQCELEPITGAVLRPGTILADVDAALAQDLPGRAVADHGCLLVQTHEGVSIGHRPEDEIPRARDPCVDHVPVRR